MNNKIRLIVCALLAAMLVSVGVWPAAAQAAPEPDPMAVQLAEAYGVEVVEIMGWRLQGLGYGEIGKAYALAQASGLSVEELESRHQAGEGWGQIGHSLGFQVMGGGTNVQVRRCEADTPCETPDDDER